MEAPGKQSISVGQLAILYISYMVGSSIVYVPNQVIHLAGNMGWLSLVVSTLMGILFMSLMIYLYRCYPDEMYTVYFDRVYGKWIAGVFVVLLILMLLLMCSYIVLGIGLFLTNTMMVETPMYVFNALTIVIATYAVHAGIEVMGRMFFLLTASMLATIVIIVCLATPLARVESLLPLFADGVKPILHGVYFLFGFPFGEMFLFSAILPFVRKESRQRVGKWMYAMTAITGILQLAVTVTAITTLGPLAGDRKYSLYAMARMIEVGQFLIGLEAIVGIALIAGSFTKTTVVLYVLNAVMSHFFRLNDNKLLLPAISFMTFLMSMMMFEMEFVFSVQVVWPLIVMGIGVGPLVLAALITMVKRSMGRG